MSIEDEFEEFYKDYLANEACENIEIEYFDVSRSLCDYINTKRDFDLAIPYKYEKGDGLKGYFENIALFQNGYIDGHYDIKNQNSLGDM